LQGAKTAVNTASTKALMGSNLPEINMAPILSFFQLYASLHMKVGKMETVGRLQIFKKKESHKSVAPLRL